MTRTALAAPDDPDDPTPEALMHVLSMAMTSMTTTADFRRASEPVERVVWHATGSSKTMAMLALAKTCPHAPRKRPWYAGLSRQLTGIAVFVAGRKRAAVDSEWRAHMSGGTGTGLPAGRQIREAAGFLRAAVTYRLHDLADLCWVLVDVVLASRALSNLIVLLAALAAAVTSIHGEGLYGLVSNFGNVAAVWAGAYGLIRTGRWWRDVKPPEHKPGRKRQ